MTPDTPLIQMLDAARLGNWTKVDECLALGAVINEMLPESQIPIIAVLAGENLPYSRVNGLIERGGFLSWAIYGAAAGGRIPLMEALLRDVDHDVDRGLNWAIFGAALSANRTLVIELHSRGASLDWAVQGAALAGDRDWVMELLKQNASPSNAISCAAEAGDANLVMVLFDQGEQDRSRLRRFVVRGAARRGHADLLESYLMDNDTVIANVALMSAAEGGHRALLAHLRTRFPVPWIPMFDILGAALGGHVALLDESLEASISLDASSSDAAISSALKGVVRGKQLDLMNQLLKRKGVGVEALGKAAEEFGWFETEKRAAEFLAKIDDSMVRKELVRFSLARTLKKSVPLLPLLQRANEPMKQYGLSYRAALAWDQHQYVVQALFACKDSDFKRLPFDIRERILQHVVGVQNVSRADAHTLSLAVRKAYTGVDERAKARAQEATELAARNATAYQAHGLWFDSLRPKMKAAIKGQMKADSLRNEDNIVDQTNALCIRRFRTIKRTNFLPSRMRETMQKFPEFRHVTALRHWLKSCAQYLSTRFGKLPQLLGSRLEALLPHLEHFPADSTDLRTFVRMLQMEVTSPYAVNDSVELILSDQPYWKDLLALFPGLKQEWADNRKDDQVSRLV